MKTIIFLCFLTVFLSAVRGQSDFKKNDIYVEAGGTGLFASVNYERQLTNKPGIGVRVGLGFYTEKAFYLTLPVGVNYLFALKNNTSFIDAGLAMSFAKINGDLFGSGKQNNADHLVNFVPSIGYRKHSANNTMWRISITPVANRDGLVPWLGFSIGKRF